MAPPSNVHFSSSPAVPSFSSTGTQTTQAVRPQATVVSLLQNGIPGIQYTYVDPDDQFQKYLIVLVQTPSGTDPLDPPDYNARLTDQGKILELTIPVSGVLNDPALLVHKNASWMQEGGPTKYENRKQVRLGGLGPAIAEAKTHFLGMPFHTIWRCPLSQVADEIIGSYSITNFPAAANMVGQRHYPVLVEFKLKTVEQSVKRTADVNTACWPDEDNSTRKRVRRSEP